MSAATDAFVRSTVTQLEAWLGKDATRQAVERMLADYQFRSGLDETSITSVLGHFDADGDPLAFVDYLPERAEGGA